MLKLRRTELLIASLVALGLLVALGPTAASAQAPPILLDDNGKIAFVSARDGDPEVYTMNPDGTQQTRLTNNTGPSPDFCWTSGRPGHPTARRSSTRASAAPPTRPPMGTSTR